MKKRYITTTILITLVVIVIGLGIYKMFSNEKDNPNNKDPDNVLKEQNDFIKDEDYLSEGKEDSKIHVVAFIDYRCSHCADYHFNIKNKVLQNYIDNGKVKYTEIPFPVIDKKSKEYAEMARVIHKSGNKNHLTEFTSKAYQSSTIDNNPIKTIKRMKLDEKEQNTIINTYKKNETNDNKSKIQSKLKISSTPTIFINGKHLKEANLLKDAVEQEMN